MANIITPGTATPADVLAPSTFSAGTNFNAAGTMPNQGSPTFTPTGSVQTGPAGYYGGVTVDAVTVKSQSGTATSSSGTGTFTEYGGTSVSLETLTITPPTGATAIVAVIAERWGVAPPNGATNLDSETIAISTGYADGATSSVLAVARENGIQTAYSLIAGGDLSITATSIVLPAGAASFPYNYTVLYI